MRTASRVSFADFLRRVFAAGAAALVFALAVFAASPGAHDSLHGSGAEHDDGCAIVLFASGVSLPLDLPTLAAPEFVLRSIAAATAAEVFLVSPRYLRQPERGPPQWG